MELAGKGTGRRALIRIDGYADARDRIEALLDALRYWDERNPPAGCTLYCIADLIGELMPSEKDCELLDRYYRDLPEKEE